MNDAPLPAQAAVPSQAANPDIETADAPGITIKFEGKRCIHSRFCVLWQPQVYKANVKGPWLTPAADTVEAIVAVAHNCPSGAIQYERHDGQPDEHAPPVNVIYIRENGPLAFRAELVVGQKALGYRATLCRCGASKNKPFCDNSHHDAGFAASGEPGSQDSPTLAVRGRSRTDRAAAERAAADARQRGDLLRDRPNGKAHDGRCFVPVWRLCEQAVLRRLA